MAFKALLLFMSLFLCGAQFPRWVVRPPDSPQSNIVLRVLIDRGGRKIPLEIEGRPLSVRLNEFEPWKVTGEKVHLSLKGQNLVLKGGLHSFEGQTLFLRGGSEEESNLVYGGKSFRGELKIQMKEKGWLSINLLKLESYLAGTLGSEMSTFWPLEALKAQAVAARSYALHRLRSPRHVNYDLSSGTEDQVYSGKERETPKILEVVRATEGEFLAFKGKPVPIFYHSRCGGQTDADNSVWRNISGYHSSVFCPYCKDHPYNWRLSLSNDELGEALRLPKALQPPAVSVATQTPSGRIASLSLSAEGKPKEISAEEFRGLVGHHRLKSARFQWKQTPSGFDFEGTGNGHGVGLCQYGTAFLARQGLSYSAILAYFYPKLMLERMSGSLPLHGAFR